MLIDLHIFIPALAFVLRKLPTWKHFNKGGKVAQSVLQQIIMGVRWSKRQLINQQQQ